MCRCDFNNMPSEYWEYQPIAEKEHICCECGSQIDIGEQYYLLEGIWDGEFLTFRQCEICKKVWDEAITSPEIECMNLGELWETVGSDFEYAACVVEEQGVYL